jgi:tetratricopeptide (TPR) repeat protein
MARDNPQCNPNPEALRGVETGMTTRTFDVFLSFTRTGHPELARRVAEVLNVAGISTFVDTSVEAGENISERLIAELRGSRLMVIVYSATYPTRDACQYELMQACLAGVAEGDLCRRILVINPEDGKGHIVPAVLAHHLYRRPSDLDRLSADVRARLAGLPEPMGTVLPRELSDWWPITSPGAYRFYGRFSDLWRLHDALTEMERPLARRATIDPVAVVTGMGGIGKTSLVRAYAWLFGALFPGGVFWIGVGGEGGIAGARSRFEQQLRELADAAGILVRGMSDEQIRRNLTTHVHRDGQHSLWVIDDLPEDATVEQLSEFALPTRLARRLFTTRRLGARADVDRIALDGLGSLDGIRLLNAFRPVAGADRAAAAEMVRRLGGHPFALRAATRVLEDQQGRTSYAAYAATLGPGGIDETVLAVIEQSLGLLDAGPLTVLALAGLLAPMPLPVSLISAVPAAVAGDLPATGDDPLTELGRHGAATRIDESWQCHPLAVEAAARLGPPPVPLGRLAVAAADALTALLADGAAAAVTARHAESLVGHRMLVGAGRADDLRRLLADRYEQLGDPVRAAALRHELAEANPGLVTDQVAAALASVANSEFKRAVDRSRQALGLGAAGDDAVRARWALASALDGLGRFDEADPLWIGLKAVTWSPPPSQRMSFGIARAHAMVARGRLRDARAVLEPLAAESLNEYPEQVNAARTALSRVLLASSAEGRARDLADQVIQWYRGNGAEQHRGCLDAELVWAEAAVAPDLFKLRPDTSGWKPARETLRRLDQVHRETAGPDSVARLGVAVVRGLVLVRLGRQQDCREVLLPLLDDISGELGDRHPWYLRARYALGLAHLQLSENAEAAALMGDTWRAQRDVLGAGHPDTLASQLEYATVLAFIGDRQRSRDLIDDVVRRLPHEIGRMNDFYGRAGFAKTLRFAPTPMLRGIQTISNLFNGWSTRKK